MNEMLERKFVYQNGSTGKVSSAPLTTRQLVLLLCPIHASAVTVLTPETLVLGISKDHQYDQSGWKACKDVPVLQEACAVWYYLLDSTEQEQQGPVSCRQVFVSSWTTTKVQDTEGGSRQEKENSIIRNTKTGRFVPRTTRIGKGKHM